MTPDIQLPHPAIPGTSSQLSSDAALLESEQAKTRELQNRVQQLEQRIGTLEQSAARVTAESLDHQIVSVLQCEGWTRHP